MINLKFLIGYDGSSNGRKVVEKTAKFANKLGANVTIINVCWGMSDNESYAILDGPKRIFDQLSVKNEIRSVRNKDPSHILIKIAEDENFDMIVVGSRGIGGVKTFFLGSVSSKVVQDAPCDVLVIKE